MAKLSTRICSHPGCTRLTQSSRCSRHQRDRHTEQRNSDKRRGSAASRGYDRRWQRARADYLAQHPVCKHCESEGLTVLATVVDHVRPHKGDQALFWSTENWQPLCKACHDRKTATEDGGFGRGPGGG